MVTLFQVVQLYLYKSQVLVSNTFHQMGLIQNSYLKGLHRL